VPFAAEFRQLGGAGQVMPETNLATLPTTSELGALSNKMGAPYEEIEILWRRLYADLTGHPDQVEMTPEQAWHLTQFARELMQWGEWFIDFGNKFDKAVYAHMGGDHVGHHFEHGGEILCA
jgi:hypothetical protein